MSIHDEFVKYPTGKIPKGNWCDGCKRFNVRNVTCTGIGIKDNKILLVLRKKDPQAGWWALPGGYLNWDETVEECVEREYREETGFKVRTNGLVGVYSSPERDLDGRQNVDCCFVMKVGEHVSKADDEIIELRWFDLDQLPDKIAFDHRKMIEDYVKLF